LFIFSQQPEARAKGHVTRLENSAFSSWFHGAWKDR
jgi:hypothetical protein